MAARTGAGQDHVVDRLSHVFPGSHAHVAGWPAKHWHSAIGDPKSSQALCVSVWGTIAAHRNRTAIIAEVFAAAGLDVGVLEVGALKPPTLPAPAPATTRALRTPGSRVAAALGLARTASASTELSHCASWDTLRELIDGLAGGLLGGKVATCVKSEFVSSSAR